MHKILLNIDINTKSLVDSTGSFINNVKDYPKIERGQWQVLCIQFVNRIVDDLGIVTITNATLDNDASFILVADNDFIDDNYLMFKSIQSTIPFTPDDSLSNRINIEGDWVDGSTASVNDGRLSIRICTSTEKFYEVLKQSYKVSSSLYINVKQYSNPFPTPSTIAYFPFIAVNTIGEEAYTSEIPINTEIASYVTAALKRPLEFQFSTDGATNWHDVQTTNDRFYRQRITGIDSEWGNAVEFIIGSGVGSTNASDIIISAESQYYAGLDVASALQQIGAVLDGLEAELEVI